MFFELTVRKPRCNYIIHMSVQMDLLHASESILIDLIYVVRLHPVTLRPPRNVLE